MSPEPKPPNPERRNETARRAILRAAMQLCREVGYARVSVDAIAAAAGVGKQTIYRWWPSKGAVVLEALLEKTRPLVSFRNTGSFEDDLKAQLRSITRVMSDPRLGPRIAEIAGEAQHDPDLADLLAEHAVRPLRALNRATLTAAKESGALDTDLDLDVIADLLFGPLWFRLLLSKAPLSAAYADAIADAVLALSRSPRSRHTRPQRAQRSKQPRSRR